jgi:hypothetical protein
MDFWQQQLQRPLPACGRCAQAKTHTKDTINALTLRSIYILFCLRETVSISAICPY